MGGRGHVSNGIDVEHDATIAAGAGKFPTVSTYSVQGYKEGITQDPALPELLSPIPLAYPLDTGEVVTLASAELADDAVMRVLGLDENLDQQEGYAILSGTTPVVIVKTLQGLEPTQWSRINEIRSIDKAIAGNVTATGVTSGAVGYCTFRDQRSVTARYSVGRNTEVQVLSILGSMLKDGGNAQAGAVLNVLYRRFGGPFYREFGFSVERRNSVDFKAAVPEVVDGPVDLEVLVYCDSSNVAAYSRAAVLLTKV